MSRTISIAKNFSRFPGGRFRTDGPFSGEAFRRKHLVPALRMDTPLSVDLNGTLGYGSSFLEEAFGGLVRVEEFTASRLRILLRFVSDDPSLVEEIWSYIEGPLQRVSL